MDMHNRQNKLLIYHGALCLAFEHHDIKIKEKEKIALELEVEIRK